MKNKVKKPMSEKTKKTLIVLSAILAVIIVLLTVYLTNKVEIQARVVYMLMPDSAMGMMDGSDEETEFFVEFNNDFDGKNDDMLEAFSYYYYDDDGNRVDLGPGGTIIYEGEETSLFYAFAIDLIKNASTAVNIIKKAAVVIVVVVVVALLILWFVLWSKRQDREKAEKYGEKPNKNKKNKIKKLKK